MFTNRLMGTEDVAHAYNTHTMEYASAIEKNGRMPFFRHTKGRTHGYTER